MSKIVNFAELINLPSASVIVGNSSGIATGVALTGDSSITNAGLLSNTGLRGVTLPALGASAGLLKYTGTGTNTWVFDANTYLTGNQTVTLSGDIAGSGATSITTTLASIITAGGPTGSTSVVPIITYDAKGRLTAVSSATITPASIGASPAAGSSSITTVGTLVSGSIPYSLLTGTPTIPTSLPTTNAVTFNNSGAGAASGTTFNGSSAQTISYNTIGASPLAGSASITTLGTIASGSIPYSLITGTPTIPTNANYVDLTTAQTVGGAKTFTGAGSFSNSTVGGTIGSVKNLTLTNTTGNVGDWAGLNFGYYNNTTNFGYIGMVLTNGASNAAADMVFGVKASNAATSVTEYLRLAVGGNITTSASASLTLGSTSGTGTGELYAGSIAFPNSSNNASIILSNIGASGAAVLGINNGGSATLQIGDATTAYSTGSISVQKKNGVGVSWTSTYGADGAIINGTINSGAITTSGQFVSNNGGIVLQATASNTVYTGNYIGLGAGGGTTSNNVIQGGVGQFMIFGYTGSAWITPLIISNTTGVATFSSTVTATGGGFDSDLTLKTIITRDIVSFYIADEVSVIKYVWNDKSKGEEQRYGYGAQELLPLIPEAVYKNGDTYAVDYTQVHTLLIDENTKRIQVLEQRIASLEKLLNI